MQSSSNRVGIFAALWAVTGFSLLILFAIKRLSAVSWDTLNSDLQWFHWLALLISIVIMAYSEGYKGFHQKFSPRFAARCSHLRHHPRTLHVLLAPLFCMGFFHATRARKITTFAVSFMILCFIIVARFLPYPWRGILDIGVVTGLVLGLLSLYYYLIKAFSSADFNHSAELPTKQKNQK